MPITPDKAFFFQTKRSNVFFISPKKRGGTRSASFCFSTFASKFLDKLTDEQLTQYDSLINKPTNDWEIYYWATGEKIFIQTELQIRSLQIDIFSMKTYVVGTHQKYLTEMFFMKKYVLFSKIQKKTTTLIIRVVIFFLFCF